MIERSVLLPCAPERAFQLFTGEASRWWPPQRRHTGDPASEITLAAGGAFFERAADGTTVDLGRVRVWEPPVRLVLDFYPGTDPDHPTEVEIAFTPEGDGTRVRVLHGPTAASAALFEGRAPTFAVSWEQVLAALGGEVGDLPSR